MKRHYVIPLLAIIGVGIAVVTVINDNRAAAVVEPASYPAMAPFASNVAAAGIVEADGGNITVGTAASGIVTAIYVKWGDQVNTGDRLFKIDDRDLQAQLPPALARIKEAKVRLDQASRQFSLADSVPDKRAISVEELGNRRSGVSIAEAALTYAKAQVEQIRMEIERRTIRALTPGKILQIKVRVGEFAQSGASSNPLMLLGDDRRLYVRVDVDENEAQRIQPGAPARAFMRSNPQLQTTLQFERIEPYVVPKSSLTGDSAERADIRVLQVIYSFERTALPVYAGQQLDVFIQALPMDTTRSGTPVPRSAGGAQ